MTRKITIAPYGLVHRLTQAGMGEREAKRLVDAILADRIDLENYPHIDSSNVVHGDVDLDFQYVEVDSDDLLNTLESTVQRYFNLVVRNVHMSFHAPMQSHALRSDCREIVAQPDALLALWNEEILFATTIARMVDSFLEYAEVDDESDMGLPALADALEKQARRIRKFVKKHS